MKPYEKINSIQDLIDFYETIPENKWQTEFFVNEYDKSICCAMGHLGVKDDASYIREVEKTLKSIGVCNGFLERFNDGKDLISRDYGNTPKQRVLSYLKGKL